ncbi:hypothetical protein [Salipaludibacillus daqingensis]|uniref:hypothetical protein n=1 Tax=Salipaludibacillus daqingensis TaxID=3041001 RepID=UPI002473CCDB|nr:hypothetical protein [Salipaludibacillus daqingensis]
MLKMINSHFFKIASISLLIAIILSITSIFPWNKMDEAFIFFPEDEQVYFREANTSLELLSKKDSDEYVLEWAFSSETNEPAFLRSDMSLLFENGTFIGARKQSLKDQLFIEEVGTIEGEDSGRYDVITFHHAEVHYSKDKLRSKHTWSQDQLFVVDSPLTPLHSFKEPATDEEVKSKKLLNSIMDQQLTYQLDGLLEEFQINIDEYHYYTLLDLPDFVNYPLPGLTQKETFSIIGQLWEGYYRYYLLGINTFTDETYSPKGNSLPNILLHKDGTHLLLLYETKDGTRQQLFQLIK